MSCHVMQEPQGYSAGAWIKAVPASGKFAVKPNENCLAAWGCFPMPFSCCISSYKFGSRLGTKGFHLLCCKEGGGPNWEHNTMVSRWSDWMPLWAGNAPSYQLKGLLHKHWRLPRQWSTTLEMVSISLAHPWGRMWSRNHGWRNMAVSEIRKTK